MPSKGKGRLSYVSNFISLYGRLTSSNTTPEGVTTSKDAREIIYPGGKD